MSQQSITNRLIGNIKQTTVNSGAFTNSNNVICIDSSTNRIGINTRDPNYSIDICGNGKNDGIRCENIYVNDIELSNDLSCNRLMGQTICGTNIIVDFIDISDCIYTGLSGNRIDVSLLVINEISANNNGFLYIPTISCDNIVSTVSADFLHIDVSSLVVSGLLKADDFVLPDGTQVNTFIVTVSGDITNLDCSTINVRDSVSINGELTVDNNTTLNGLTVQSDASFVGKIEAHDACFNLLDVSNILRVNNLQNSNGDSILNEGRLELTGAVKMQDASVNIGTLTVKDNFISEAISTFTDTVTFRNNINIVKEGGNSGLTFTNSYLKIPTKPLTDVNGQFYFDPDNKSLNMVEKNANNEDTTHTFTSKILYATYELSNNYYAENSNNLFIDITSNSINKQIKYIPISRKNSSDVNKFLNESSNNSIIINNTYTNKSYEINANVCLKYINVNPGDVEPNTFEFLLIRNNDNDVSFTELISNKNTIIAFDTSFNYVTTSLTYIEDNFSTDASGFMFGIYSSKDLSYLHIDSFYTTIKEL